MHIAIDTHAIGNKGHGNSSHFEGLIEGLTQIDFHNRYTILATRDLDFYQRIRKISNFSIKRIYSRGAFERILVHLPILTFKENINVLHVQYQIPPISACPVVVTIHDLYWEHYPQAFGFLHLLLSKIYVRWSARHATKIITVSEYSANDIHNIYNVPKEKIAVIPNGKSERFIPIQDKALLSLIKKKYGIEDGFILFLGRTDDPRKNLIRLIKAYAYLKQSKRIKQKLLIVGRQGRLTLKLWKLVEDLGLNLKKEVIFAGLLSEFEIPILMAAANVFVFPSIFEGFGLPPLEAMACGTPVIVSNTTSLPEVVGDAGILINPFNVDELAHAIEVLLNDHQLHEILSHKSLERAKMFSWKKMAENTLKVYFSIT